MNFGTGCISVAVDGSRGLVSVHRIIEYFHADQRSCTLWVDVFFENRGSDAGNLLVLHRGSLSATDVTCASWLPDSDAASGWERPLTRRIRLLHRDYHPIDVHEDKTVTVDDRVYRVWNGSGKSLRTVVGSDTTRDVPFTLWELGPLADPGRWVFRLRLSMGDATFAAGIGRDRAFSAYGESILLDKIIHEDLPSDTSSGRDRYVSEFHRFTERADRVVPDAFEYLVVGTEGEDLGWEAVPLTPRLFQQSIGIPELERATRWFTVDESKGSDWRHADSAYGSWVLDVREPALAGR